MNPYIVQCYSPDGNIETIQLADIALLDDYLRNWSQLAARGSSAQVFVFSDSDLDYHEVDHITL